MAGVGDPCRCGSFYTPEGLPCRMCWDHTADDQLVRLLVELAAENRAQALPMLASIGDPRAAPLLRAALAEESSLGLRRALTVSLGWSGDGTDIPTLQNLLAEPIGTARFDAEKALRNGALRLFSSAPSQEALDHRMISSQSELRCAALESIAELGGPTAADILHQAVMDGSGPERQIARAGLAWLRDPRARDLLRESMNDWLTSLNDGQVKALLRVGEAADVQLMVERVLSTARPGPEDRVAHQRLVSMCQLVLHATQNLRPEFSSIVDEPLTGLLQELFKSANPGRDPRPAEQEAVASVRYRERTVPSRVLRFDRPDTARGSKPRAKFRGQPDWRTGPAWPVGERGPLIFYGQLPLSGNHTVYIFVAEGGDAGPLGQGNALVVQPGPPTHLPTIP